MRTNRGGSLSIRLRLKRVWSSGADLIGAAKDLRSSILASSRSTPARGFSPRVSRYNPAPRDRPGCGRAEEKNDHGEERSAFRGEAVRVARCARLRRGRHRCERPGRAKRQARLTACSAQRTGPQHAPGPEGPIRVRMEASRRFAQNGNSALDESGLLMEGDDAGQPVHS